MPINQETLNRRLYKVLHNRFKDTTALDSEGDVSPIEDEADIFRFTFTKDGKEYGKVYITVDNSKTLKIYYGDDVTESPGVITPGSQYNDTWYGFTEFMKRWSMSNQLGWEPTDKDHLEGDMARRNHVKKQEKMMEGYYPMGKKASYNDAVPNVKMVIQHTREIQEGEQRYRNVARIFLENSQGERILAPTTKPGIARVYARHIAEGGVPNDDRWNHLKGLCEEYSKMAGFVRATRGKQFNESAQGLIESGINHYNSLRESLSKMSGHRGYNMYFESWTPPLMEDDDDTSSITELFVQETMDPRIESVMPILSKLHKTVAEMKEVDQLAEWADSLLEGPSVTAQQSSDSPAMRGSPALAHYAAQLDQDLEEDESLTSNNPQGIPEDAKAHTFQYHDPRDDKRKTYVAKSKSKDAAFNEFKKYVSGLKTTEQTVAESYRVVPGFDKEKYQERQGLEGPFHTKSGKVVYYDKVEGKYYDPDTDMYIEYDDWQAMNEQGVAEDLDSNQKRVGQLGPTEKVGKKGAVGKLVGANENFIGMAPQAVAEGQEDLAAILRIINR